MPQVSRIRRSRRRRSAIPPGCLQLGVALADSFASGTRAPIGDARIRISNLTRGLEEAVLHLATFHGLCIYLGIKRANGAAHTCFAIQRNLLSVDAELLALSSSNLSECDRLFPELARFQRMRLDLVQPASATLPPE
jgi:hypothetical protein